MSYGLAIKRGFAVVLSFLVLSSAFASFCLAAPLSWPGADQAPHFEDQGHSHHPPEPSSNTDEVPCHKMQLCCPWIAQNTGSYFFVPDTSTAAVSEIAFRLLHIVRPLYHPPETLL
jgi:hypothetical protein